MNSGTTGTAPAKMIESTEGFVVRQNGHESYVVKFKAGDLVNHIEVAQCDPTTPEGYQRPESKKRVAEIGSYVDEGGEIPPALVLSSRKKPVAFGKGRFGWLVPLFAIDGQHRGAGLRKAIEKNPKLANFEIACVIKAGLSVEEEAQLFAIINRTQVKVSNNLTQAIKYTLSKTQEGKDLLAETPTSITADPKNDWEIRAYRLAYFLNTDGGIVPTQNPLQGRIKLVTSTSDGTQKNAVTQGTMLRSLEYVVQDDEIDGRSVGKFLSAYWRGVALTYPKAIASPSDHTVVRTLGVEILNRSFPTIYRIVKKHGGDVLNPLHYKKVLMLAEGWASGNPWSIGHANAKARTDSKFFADKANEFTEQIKKNEFALIKGF